MNKNLKKVLLLGYFYSVTGALLGTIAFAFLDAVIYVILNGWTTKWGYLNWLLIPGGIISVGPAGMGGIILSYMLWKNAQNGTISKKKAFFTGGILGLDSILFSFLIAYISPLNPIFLRMNLFVAIEYLLLSLLLAYFIGGWVGNKLAFMLNKQFE